MGAAQGGQRPGGAGGLPAALRPAAAALGAALALGACARVPREPPVVLARGASRLCAAGPRRPRLSADLGLPARPGALTAVPDAGPEGDGAFVRLRVGGLPVLQVRPARNPAGGTFAYEALYFTAGGALPAGTRDVLLCLQVDDRPAGVDLEAQYSGAVPVGPGEGAYDAAPEAYRTGGSDGWLVASFNFTDVRFRGGPEGPGRENAGADFRVVSRQALPWDAARAWLVVRGVPARPAPPDVPTP